jgi:preprotein translocase subunit SecB
MQGGFPQFLLPPVNFEALYARSAAEGRPGAANGQTAPTS